MNVERKRPIKQFRVTQAFGPYRKGDLTQPTGMYRDVLLKRGVIEEVVEEEPPKRVAQAEFDRMVPEEALGVRDAAPSSVRKRRP